MKKTVGCQWTVQPNAREAPWSDDVQRGGFGAWSEAPSRKRWTRAPPQEGVSGKLRREQRAGGKQEAERWEGTIGWEAIKKM